MLLLFLDPDNGKILGETFSAFYTSEQTVEGV